MKETIRNLVNKTYIIHAIFIISMTQSIAFAKLFWLSGFIHDGSFGEFAAIMGSVAVSVIALLAFICLTMEKDDSKKMNYKGHLFKCSLYLIGTIILISIVNSIIDRTPEQFIWDISTNTSHIYDVVFNKTLYIIDMLLVGAIYITRKLYKIWNFLLQVLVFKMMFMIGIYLAAISYLNIYNTMIDKNPNAFLPTTFFCKDTYVETYNIFFIKNTDCPFKDSKDQKKELAKSGSTWAYISTMNQKMDLREKAAIVVMFYESNKNFDNKTWIEKNIPSLYNDSMLKQSKVYYHRNKDAELAVAKMILAGQDNQAIEKAKQLLAENKPKKEDKSQYNFLNSIVKP